MIAHNAESARGITPRAAHRSGRESLDSSGSCHTSLDFPMRPLATAARGGLGISRFPRGVLTYVHGVSDRAGFPCTSRYRCKGRSLPLTPTASASRSVDLTRLNTRPARSPVNASTPPLRAAPHDSGPMWVAEPLSYDFFIHYTSPV